MADQEQIPPKPETREETDQQGSVFGNLPGNRPGVRSPRRRGTGPASATGAAAKGAGDQPRSSAQKPEVPQPPRYPAGRSPESSETAQRRTSPPAEAEHGGVEDLAWAGVAVAAEAATLGVRLLSRAVEAVRRPSDRR